TRSTRDWSSDVCSSDLAHLVHPYDDDRIIAGQATAAKELLEEVGDLHAVFAPVSGGGLLSGTCLGAKGIRADVRVFGCEPERARSEERRGGKGRAWVRG